MYGSKPDAASNSFHHLDRFSVAQCVIPPITVVDLERQQELNKVPHSDYSLGLKPTDQMPKFKIL